MPAGDFNTLLSKLRASGEDDQTERSSPGYRVSSDVALKVLSLTASRTVNRAQAPGYYDVEEAPPAPQLSFSDLKTQIEKAASVAELRRLRRNFARLSHPDCRKNTKDAAAATEMALANKLIDEAISSMRKRP